MTYGFQEEEGEGRENGDEGGDTRKTGANRHPDGGDEPDVRRGRESGDVVLVVDERAGAEKADAGHDLRRHARWVGDSAEESLDREDGEEAGAYGDDHVRPDAGGLPAPVSFNADDEAEECREEDLRNVFRGEGPVHTSGKYTLPSHKGCG